MTYFLDLFAGIGGFRLGAEWAGLQFGGHYYSEVDPYAIKVYSLRFPDSIPLGDIRSIHGADLPVGDWIIAGGFPCQDISVAGKGAGLAGERSGLWYEYARLIGELRPRYAIMENVGALAFRGLDSVLGSLAALGYDAEWQDIRASDVGAPHRRERIWIVAYPEGSGSGRIGSGTETRFAGARSSGALPSFMADSERIEGGERYRAPMLGRRTDETEQARLGSGDVADSPDGWNVRRNGELEPAQGEVLGHRRSPEDGRGEWWATEPDVGGTIDGFSSWLDANKCLTIQSHECIMSNVIRFMGGSQNDEKKREYAGEILRILRDENGTENIQRTPRGFERIQEKEILFTYLCKLEEAPKALDNLSPQSAEIQEGLLRGLRVQDEPTGSPYRPEPGEQRTREYTDALQALSRLLAHDSKEAWEKYCRENAEAFLNPWNGDWEKGIPRVAHGVPSRVARLKCLGNSIVPQIAGMIFSSSVFDEWRGI